MAKYTHFYVARRKTTGGGPRVGDRATCRAGDQIAILEITAEDSGNPLQCLACELVKLVNEPVIPEEYENVWEVFPIPPTYTHVFEDRGEGYPENGELVICDDGLSVSLLRVIDSSPIHTGTPGSGKGNHIYLICAPAVPGWDSFSAKHQERLWDTKFHVHEDIDEEDTDE